MIKVFRADQLFPSSAVATFSDLQKAVRKSREVASNIIQQLIDTGYIPEEKKEELLSDFDKGINELLQFKKVEKKNKTGRIWKK